MNWNSYLCQYLATHKETWEEDLSDVIDVKKEGNLAIFNYARGANFTDPIVREARGIIIDINRLEVVCWPFNKFGNWDKDYADEIDWNSALITEKMDGSILKLWHDRERGWRFSTNAEITPVPQYAAMIREAFLPYGGSDYPEKAMLDSNKTYIFELVSPKNRIIVPYDETKVYHIGTRDNKTGKETNVFGMEGWIGIPNPPVYVLGNGITIKDCVAEAMRLNFGSDQVKKEGFVVVDKNFHRIKVKSPEWLKVHHAILLGLSKEDAMDVVKMGDAYVKETISECPSVERQLMFYSWQFSELAEKTDAYVRDVRTLYASLGNDRKALAEEIKDHPLSKYAFYGLGNELSAKEILSKERGQVLAKFVEDYKPVTFTYERELELKKEKEMQALMEREMEREYGPLDDGSPFRLD